MECRVTRNCTAPLYPGGKNRYRREGAIVNWEGPLDEMPRWFDPTSGPAPDRSHLPDVPTGRQGIVPPSTKKKAEEVKPLSSQDPSIAIQQALTKLDPEDDDQWTKLGLARLEVLEEILGHEVGRAAVREADPGFDRDAARAAKRVAQ